MKIAFIFVLYKTPESEIRRLRKEVGELTGLRVNGLYFIDNTKNNRGYAAGVNEGIRKAIDDGCDLFVIANPDISFQGHPTGGRIIDVMRHFDIGGLAMEQQGKTYFGGEIDRWRMSGGLITKKPEQRFKPVDFVSGSLLVVKKEVIDRIGFLDESYFLYYEEVDFCWRAKRAGFKVGIDAGLAYEHFETSKSNPKKELYLFKNRIKFLLKYGSWQQKSREIIRLPKTVFEEVKKRPFYLNFFSLNLSSVFNKVLSFVLFLVLIRNFIPSEYAIYTLAWTQVGLFLPLLDFGTTTYGLVYLPFKAGKNESSLFSFRVVLAAVTFVLTIASALVFRFPTKELIAICLTSIVIFANSFSGSFLIFTSVAEKSYLVSVVSTIFQTVLVVSLITAVFLTRQMMSVFFVIFVVYGLYAVLNIFLVKNQIKEIVFRINWRSWLPIVKKSLPFLIISLLAGFYSRLDIFVLNFLKGAREVGIYTAAGKFVDALMFLVTSYNVSAMPLFAKLLKTNKPAFLLKIKKDAILLGVIGFGVAIGIAGLGPLFLPLVMKGDYRTAIAVLQIVIFSVPLVLLTSIAINCLYALGKVRSIIFLFGFQLIYNVVFNFIFIPKYGFFASSWISVMGELINTVICFYLLKKTIDENFR
ncbi:polysaccharide biosynthesis C-terminal domain-containing protein [Patescibacteria group bacterium]|nr:polysaccharide biosynthesis C-terminal domain-containing protein [Patescibacteria group bacterium]